MSLETWYWTDDLSVLLIAVAQRRAAWQAGTITHFVGPQMALAYQLDAISQGLKTLEFQGPTPSHFPRNGYARIQNIMHGAV